MKVSWNFYLLFCLFSAASTVIFGYVIFDQTWCVHAKQVFNGNSWYAYFWMRTDVWDLSPLIGHECLIAWHWLRLEKNCFWCLISKKLNTVLSIAWYEHFPQIMTSGHTRYFCRCRTYVALDQHKCYFQYENCINFLERGIMNEKK